MVKKYLIATFLFYSSFAHASFPVNDCNTPQNYKEKFVCFDDELRDKNNKMREWAKVDYGERNILVKTFLRFNDYQSENCTNKKCIADVYDSALKWFENKEYDITLQESLKPRCEIKNLKSECEVYVYAQYGGKEKSKGSYISDKHATDQTTVKINRPNKCVIVFLNSYEPTIWDIYITPETQPVSIIAGGYYPQMLRGMATSVETINRRESADEDICLSQYYDKEEIKDVVQALKLGTQEPIILETSIIGDVKENKAYFYNKKIYNGEYYSLDIPPGKEGLDQLEQEKKIRKLNHSEIQKIKDVGFEFINGTHPPEYAKEHILRYGYGINMYIMLDNFEKLPCDLAGSNSITLFIPKGLTSPDNNEGHNNFYRINTTVDEIRAWK